MVANLDLGLSAAAGRPVDASKTYDALKLVQIKSLHTVTLDRGNFFTWRAQFTALLRSHGLIDYVENADRVRSSPLFERQDQLILDWLLSSMSPEVLPQVAAFTTAGEVWAALFRLFSSSSKTWVLFLRREFQSLNKGGSSMTEYIAKANRLIDTLAVTGERLEQGDIILTVLGGLGAEFDGFVTAVTTRLDPTMTFVDLQAMLLDQELCMTSYLPVNPSSSVNTVVAEERARSTDNKYAPCQIYGRKGHIAAILGGRK